MGGQPGQDDGEGAGPDRDPEPTPRRHGPSCPRPTLGWPRSRGTTRGRRPAPSGRLALLVDELSGPGRRCPGATDDELIGLLRAWAAIESWAAGAKLGVIREIMRREAPPSPGSDHGDLPETWSPSLRYELAGRAGLLDPVGRDAPRRSPGSWRRGCQASAPGSRTGRSPRQGQGRHRDVRAADRPRRRRRRGPDRWISSRARPTPRCCGWPSRPP